jgi:L-rhamnose mutarotase
MLNFVIGLLWGLLINKNSIMKIGEQVAEEYEREHSTYIPKFNGYYHNIGTRSYKNWVWKEPKYRYTTFEQNPI